MRVIEEKEITITKELIKGYFSHQYPENELNNYYIRDFEVIRREGDNDEIFTRIQIYFSSITSLSLSSYDKDDETLFRSTVLFEDMNDYLLFKERERNLKTLL